MDYFSIWPTIGILAILFGLAATPAFASADSPPIPTTARVSTLDGLRGFLALGVFFHHAAIYHRYLASHVWQAPAERFYAMLGPGPVAMFFMITGFLFWSQMAAKRGRPDWIKLYVGRVFRIGPIYLVAILIMLATVFWLTRGQLVSPPARLAKEVAKWLALGIIPGGPVNGARTSELLTGMSWTLAYEWAFYASLLVTAIFARSKVAVLWFPAISLIVSLMIVAANITGGPAGGIPQFVALFSAGMLTASVRSRWPDLGLPPLVGSIVAAAALLILLAGYSNPYAVLPMALLMLSFFLIANGATLFGLLSSRTARRLGDISFGIYLLQGLVQAAVFTSRPGVELDQASPVGHWGLTLVSGIALLIVATASHVLIERPGIELGRMVFQRIKRPDPSAIAQHQA